METKVKNLSNLKEWLLNEGAQLQMVEYLAWNKEIDGWQSVTINHNISGWRTVEKVQSNAFSLKNENGDVSWVDFGKSGEWKFDRDHAIKSIRSGDFIVDMRYELRIQK